MPFIHNRMPSVAETACRRKRKRRAIQAEFPFIGILTDYLVWYNEKRIKVSLGNMRPVEYRRSLGIAA